MIFAGSVRLEVLSIEMHRAWGLEESLAGLIDERRTAEQLHADGAGQNVVDRSAFHRAMAAQPSTIRPRGAASTALSKIESNVAPGLAAADQ